MQQKVVKLNNHITGIRNLERHLVNLLDLNNPKVEKANAVALQEERNKKIMQSGFGLFVGGAILFAGFQAPIFAASYYFTVIAESFAATETITAVTTMVAAWLKTEGMRELGSNTIMFLVNAPDRIRNSNFYELVRDKLCTKSPHTGKIAAQQFVRLINEDIIDKLKYFFDKAEDNEAKISLIERGFERLLSEREVEFNLGDTKDQNKFYDAIDNCNKLTEDLHYLQTLPNKEALDVTKLQLIKSIKVYQPLLDLNNDNREIIAASVNGIIYYLLKNSISNGKVNYDLDLKLSKDAYTSSCFIS